MMKRSGLRVALLALSAAAGVGALVQPLPAAAQATNFHQEWNDIKDALPWGGGEHAPIDFSERAPLVVPPSNDLPPPVAAAPQLGVRDADEVARRKALSDPRRPVPVNDPGAAAAGADRRAYLIDPPSGTEDPAAVAAEGAPQGPQTEKPHKHHKKKFLGLVSR